MIAVDLITHSSVVVYAVMAGLLVGWIAEEVLAILRREEDAEDL